LCGGHFLKDIMLEDIVHEGHFFKDQNRGTFSKGRF